MKSTWSYFKGRIRRKGSSTGPVAASATSKSVAAAAGEWDEEAPATPGVGQIPCKNRRVTDGSLLTCLGSDASALANKTRLSRTRAWRYLESRLWLSGCQPSAAASNEASSLLPCPPNAALSDSSHRPLLQPSLRRSVSGCCLDADNADDADDALVNRPRRNSLSVLDENIGSDLPYEKWHLVVDDAGQDSKDKPQCATPDLITFDTS